MTTGLTVLRSYRPADRAEHDRVRPRAGLDRRVRQVHLVFGVRGSADESVLVLESLAADL
jgi:hypothetical protein